MGYQHYCLARILLHISEPRLWVSSLRTIEHRVAADKAALNDLHIAVGLGIHNPSVVGAGFTVHHILLICNEVHPRCLQCERSNLACSFSSPTLTKPPLNEDSLADLELLEHWHRYPVTGDMTETTRQLQYNLVRLGLSHHYLLNSILGLTALQLYSEDRSQSKWYVRAVAHQQAAITRARPHFESLTEGHEQALLGFSAFMSMYAVAEPIYRPSGIRCESPFDPVEELLNALRFSRSTIMFVQQSFPPAVVSGSWLLTKFATDHKISQLEGVQRKACIHAARALFRRIATLSDNIGDPEPGKIVWGWGLESLPISTINHQLIATIMSLPRTTKGWAVVGQGSFDNLKFDTKQPLPELSDNEVLVKFHAASLNFRDIMIAQGTYPFDVKPNIIPGSDGAGEIVAIGNKVTRFQKGSKVMTLFMQTYFGGPLTPKVLGSAVGGSVDGTLREYGVFNENGLVDMPRNLSYLEAATLPCSALTAWNALYGLKAVLPGDWVLTQGTGGVSISALQFAKAAGARVVATTSSATKAQKLKELGADHVINYKEIPNWGDEAKRLTGGGVDHVLEVGGAHTIMESLKAVNIGGFVTIIGWIAGPGETGPSFPQILSSMAVVRGIVVGSRAQFEAMVRAIEASDIKPVLDKQVFKLEELKDAYQYVVDQKHFSKVVIKIE
ncbi:alcohol dehydrogenase [Fusarium napiforme]|uniref:Alcohol dehydrogenase n=1 Tax=Fusarium napiforme TaxID=42672 RepID=A0A8H5JNA2_9HYPO|nr:alcohol dehydrogenase [Fusarium napiforme]